MNTARQITHFDQDAQHAADATVDEIRDTDMGLQDDLCIARRLVADIIKRFASLSDLTPDEQAFLAHLKGASERLHRATYVMRDVYDGGGVYFETAADRRSFNLKPEYR